MKAARAGALAGLALLVAVPLAWRALAAPAPGAPPPGSAPRPRDAAALDALVAPLERPALRRPPPRDVFTRAFVRARLEELDLDPRGVAGSDPRVALVSGRLLRVGDRLDVFEVTAIEAAHVRLSGPGGTTVLVDLPEASR